MNKSEILKILREWEDVLCDLESNMSYLFGLLGMAPESPMASSIYSMQGAYTRLVAEKISWDIGALEDWCFSHSFGERPMQAGFPNEPLRTISNIEELAQFIADDHARCAS